VKKSLRGYNVQLSRVSKAIEGVDNEGITTETKREQVDCGKAGTGV